MSHLNYNLGLHRDIIYLFFPAFLVVPIHRTAFCSCCCSMAHFSPRGHVCERTLEIPARNFSDIRFDSHPMGYVIPRKVNDAGEKARMGSAQLARRRGETWRKKSYVRRAGTRCVVEGGPRVRPARRSSTFGKPKRRLASGFSSPQLCIVYAKTECAEGAECGVPRR